MGLHQQPHLVGEDIRRHAGLDGLWFSNYATVVQWVRDGQFIGTEVPVPGGAVDGLGHLQITRPEAVATTYHIHRTAFAKAGQQAAEVVRPHGPPQGAGPQVRSGKLSCKIDRLECF